MAAEPQSAEEVVRGFNDLREQVNQIYQKINELEMQNTEHKLVLTTIGKMEKERKCYRLVGGVLVERTVGEVIPAVERNKEGLTELVKKLTEQLELKKKEMDDYQKKYNIRIKGESSSSSEAKKEASSSGEGGQGILVATS
eukprot:scaffold246_cov414-Prasinococcus_capsulatus_cf.AAC.34